MALWLFISRLSRLIFDQIRKLLLTYWLHASKYFCFTLQWRENFFNSLPVIHISDSTLLMQETVISFEEVMQTKLKVKLCIFQSLSNPCILQKRVVFQAKVFFSNSWFIVKLCCFFFSYLKCFAFGYITIDAFCWQSAELYLESIVTKIFKLLIYREVS